MSSIYIHIPFCDTLCNYCDFCKVINYQKFVDKYLTKLEEEIENEYDFNNEVSTLYIGGGTPSALSISQLEQLFCVINKFKFSSDYEFTFECNIENLSDEKIKFLASNRVNRISIGIQTFNERLLKIINRDHTYNQLIEKLNMIKLSGISNINVDLMFNLPTQTLEELYMDLKLFLELDVNHISIYSLILEKKSVFYHRGVVVDEDLGADMFEVVIDKLASNGYNHYEISNFSKVGFESKHNLVYWNLSDYYGFGLGAHSFLNGSRFENTTSITSYLSGVKKTGYSLDKRALMQEYLFLGLRKLNGINISDFESKFGECVTIFDFEDVLNDLVIIDNGYLKLTKRGLFLANLVFEKFVD